jgi:hypothetical protein
MFPNNNPVSEPEGITISRRQASILVALFLFLALSVFIIGYFLGKKSLLDSLTDSFDQQIEQVDQAAEAFEDIETAPEISAVADETFAFDREQDVAEEPAAPVAAPNVPVEQAISASAIKKNLSRPVEPVSVEPEDAEAPVRVYAELIGFHSKQSAVAFQTRLAKKNIQVIIKTRSSRAVKGRVRYWYQAMTPVYPSFKELEETVKKIQKLEFIKTKDINIVHIKKQEDQV